MEIKEELKKTKMKNERLMEELRMRMDGLGQYSRRNTLRLYGIVEENNENCKERVLKVINYTLNIAPEKIERCHRAGKYNRHKTRSVLVKFSSYKD